MVPRVKTAPDGPDAARIRNQHFARPTAAAYFSKLDHGFCDARLHRLIVPPVATADGPAGAECCAPDRQVCRSFHAGPHIRRPQMIRPHHLYFLAALLLVSATANGLITVGRGNDPVPDNN